MQSLVRATLAAALILLPAGPIRADPQRPAPQADLSDAAVVAAIIAASIAAYRAATGGNCACPDDTDKAGRRCGGRSAHSRAGGHSVLCGPADVSPAMVAAWRAGQGKR